MEGTVWMFPLYSQAGCLLKSYARENKEPEFQPEGWRGHVELNLSHAGVDLRAMRRLVERFPDAYQYEDFFYELCRTKRPCHCETMGGGGLGRTLYEGVMKAFQDDPETPASRQAHDFSIRCEEHFEKITEKMPDWQHFNDLFYGLLKESLKGLAKTDQYAEHFQAIMDQPGVLINGVLAGIRADLEAGRRPGQGRPFGPSDLSLEKPNLWEAMEPPAPWVWPPEILALAVFLRHAEIGENYRLLYVPKNLTRAEEALAGYGLDVELLTKLARYFPCVDVSGKDLLDFCRKTPPKAGRKKQGAARRKTAPRGQRAAK